MKFNFTATIEELNRKGWTFTYKKRKWFRGAWLPWKQEWEIHTLSGDKCTTIPNGTIVTHVEYYIGSI